MDVAICERSFWQWYQLGVQAFRTRSLQGCSNRDERHTSLPLGATDPITTHSYKIIGQRGLHPEDIIKKMVMKRSGSWGVVLYSRLFRPAQLAWEIIRLPVCLKSILFLFYCFTRSKSHYHRGVGLRLNQEDWLRKVWLHRYANSVKSFSNRCYLSSPACIPYQKVSENLGKVGLQDDRDQEGNTQRIKHSIASLIYIFKQV